MLSSKGAPHTIGKREPATNFRLKQKRLRIQAFAIDMDFNIRARN
jgi:hypothetical protein